ncbi:hypothetical protein HPP92_011752 [Vanilla planifolia]|uniref:PPC domain-containing protein n=1 Tax=Vanilla planifolia TaxID=51239 RepID=A0A835V3T2_VANPL|nr:hypothetical protein HPP92_011752 [Vanilla planifolia]
MADYTNSPAVGIALAHGCEDDDEDSGGIRGRSEGKELTPPSAASGATSSSGRKPRGRPPGSKNKPKPPVVITRESESAMLPVLLEVAAGSDVLERVAAFARRRRVGISILGGSGAVSNAALRQTATSAAAFTISGRFEILSLSGTFLPPTAGAATASALTISLAGARGEVIGGAVAGPVTAAGVVVVVGATFLAAEFHRLPEAEEDDAGREDGGDVKALLSPPTTSTASEFGSLGSSKQLSHDMVLWAAPPVSSRSICAPLLRPPHY